MAERESELEERERHDREIAEENRERQIRQGVISESQTEDESAQSDKNT